MAANLMTRRDLLSRSSRQASSSDSMLDQLIRALKQEKLIPVIGDTIRLTHIFDVDMDGATGQGEPANDPDGLSMSMIEVLSDRWADAVGYPLRDRAQLARVAQFHAVNKENPIVAKEDYLLFLKDTLLDVAANVADIEQDDEQLEVVEKLSREGSRSLVDIAETLEFPRFPDGKEDPLRVLARLPIKIYLTTSHYDFIERALRLENKNPQSRLCFWNTKPETVAQAHRFDPEYEPDVNKPVVYHLFGMEAYPESMVLSEDDYLRFLWRLARDLPGDSGERIIPPFLEAELNAASLLLLGYRLEDWDLRLLFHGLLNPDRIAMTERRPSVAIQLDPKEQPLVNKEMAKKADEYINGYFKKAGFGVKCQDSDEFIDELWQAWQSNNMGGAA